MLIIFQKVIPQERIPLVVPNIECLEVKTVNELGIVMDGIVLG